MLSGGVMLIRNTSMQTILIAGGTHETRNTAIAAYMRSLAISAFDRIEPANDALSIGISDIRAFTKKLSLAPHDGTHVAGIIAYGEKLTVEAQQALLKTLEEPPLHAYIIIGVPNTALLLPTILSRCVSIRLPDTTGANTPEQFQKERTQLQEIITSPPGKKIAILLTLGKTKEELVIFIDSAIVTLRRLLLEDTASGKTQHTKQYAHLLHALIETKKYQENNVNLTLLLEHAFLSIP